MKLGIVDYGMGNIFSIKSTLEYIGINDIIVSNEFESLKRVDKLILPGVGSFAKAMNNIKESNIDLVLKELVQNQKKDILGICLGMQLLSNSSDEDGINDGLKFIDMNVSKFDNNSIKIPHVGFNQIEVCENSILYNGIGEFPDFYFTHSYRMFGDFNINQSYCNYGDRFIASYEFGNIFGTQFHPELSQMNGIRLLQNFINYNNVT